MTLSQMANQANQSDDERRAAAATEYQREVAKHAEAKIAKLVGNLDVPVVALGVVGEQVLKVYNDSRHQSTHAIHRYRVDDVVLRLEAGSRDTGGRPYAPEIGYVAVERTCDGCGRAVGAPISYYTSCTNDPAKQAERFVKEVGSALRQAIVCSFCAADVAPTCPTCGRSNR